MVLNLHSIGLNVLQQWKEEKKKMIEMSGCGP